MSWTAPRTWVAGETVTAALMNAHLRDNLKALNGDVAKTADEDVTSSTVLQNDDHLTYTIAATGTYVFKVVLLGTSAANAAGHLNVGFSFPTGTCYVSGIGPNTSLASGTSTAAPQLFGGTITSGTAFASYGLSTSSVGIQLRGRLVATATGTLQLMWSQAVSSASKSTLKAGSWMTVKQVA